MTIPAIYKFVNWITGTPVPIDDAMASALSPPVDTSLLAALLALIPANPNLLINPDGILDQRNGGASISLVDGQYGSSDRWYTLVQTAAIALQRQTNSIDGIPFFQRLTQSQAVSQRMGRCQIIEMRNCIYFRANDLVLSGKIRCSSSQAIRYAILEWPGTADSPTKDVVLDWISTNYTTNAFFLSTINVIAVGAITPTAATWTDITEITGVAGSSMNNLYVFIWTQDVAVQNVTLDFVLKLEASNKATSMTPRNFNDEVSLCQRFYTKTYDLETVPGTVTDVGRMTTNLPAAIAGIAAFDNSFATQTREAGVTIWYSTNNGASAAVFNGSTGLNVTVSSTDGIGQGRVGKPNLVAAQSTGDQLRAHYSYEAELGV